MSHLFAVRAILLAVGLTLSSNSAAKADTTTTSTVAPTTTTTTVAPTTSMKVAPTTIAAALCVGGMQPPCTLLKIGRLTSAEILFSNVADDQFTVSMRVKYSPGEDYGFPAFRGCLPQALVTYNMTMTPYVGWVYGGVEYNNQPQERQICGISDFAETTVRGLAPGDSYTICGSFTHPTAGTVSACQSVKTTGKYDAKRSGRLRADSTGGWLLAAVWYSTSTTAYVESTTTSSVPDTKSQNSVPITTVTPQTITVGGRTLVLPRSRTTRPSASTTSTTSTSTSTTTITTSTTTTTTTLPPTTTTTTTTTSTTSTSTSTTTTSTSTTTSTTTVPIAKCTNSPNAIRGSDISCDNGLRASTNSNVFGGQDIYLRGTGNKVATVKPNATGGIDISTNGKTVKARENVFGGQDFYENGKKIATSRPNGTGGIDVYQGNKKTLTCTANRAGKTTCR